MLKTEIEIKNINKNINKNIDKNIDKNIKKNEKESDNKPKSNTDLLEKKKIELYEHLQWLTGC